MMQSRLNLGHELVVSLFAGGGGSSLGMEQALARPVDVAVNHDAQAVAQHQANHPETRHYCESVFKVSCEQVTRRQPVGLLWASPDCTHHSKAKGGKPVSKKIRGLAWVVVKWARRCRPRVVMLENVEEFEDWGPVTKAGRPCPVRKGQEFEKFVRQLERLGYQVEWKLLRACDFGVPTIRRRLFLIARRDGIAIQWPDPTHGARDSLPVRSGKLAPYRSAAECIDWSIPCPSIFERKRPLAENTLRRIARGIHRFVLEAAEPFIVTCNHGGDGFRGQGLPDPLRTITAAHDAHGLVTPTLVGIDNKSAGASSTWKVGDPLTTITTENRHAIAAPYFIPRHGEHAAQKPRVRSVEPPMPTVTGTANGASLVAAFMAKHYGGNYRGPGNDPRDPASTVTAKDHNAVVAAHLLNQKGTDQRHRDLREPANTVCAGGNHAGLVAALMAPYYGSGSGETGRDLREPAPTVTSRDRLQLVTVNIAGETYVLTDIGMRMLQPRELYRAQGFPDSYIIDRGPDGKRLPKYVQVRMCGNSVCPPLARAIVEANFAHEQDMRVTA